MKYDEYHQRIPNLFVFNLYGEDRRDKMFRYAKEFVLYVGISSLRASFYSVDGKFVICIVNNLHLHRCTLLRSLPLILDFF